MRQTRSAFAAGIVFLMFVLPSIAASGAEESVPLDKVPKPVLDAVKARFKDAKLTDASKETEDGKLTYEITVHDKGQQIDVTLTPEGEIVLIEKTIAAK